MQDISMKNCRTRFSERYSKIKGKREQYKYKRNEWVNFGDSYVKTVDLQINSKVFFSLPMILNKNF